jgi:hypothetical protein
MLTMKSVKVYLHDYEQKLCESYLYGRSEFSLRDFLLPNVKNVKLRSDVVPVKH